MSKRRNKRNHRQARAHSTKVPESQKETTVERKYEWVSIEEHNEDGCQILPRKAIQATEWTTYDSEKHKDLDLIINTGMAPEGAIIGQYKLYEMQKFSMKGWRMKAEAIVELPLTKGYEKMWFEAFKGSNVEINDPGLPGSISEKFKMKINKTDFNKKEISYANKDSVKTEKILFEAHLWMKETFKSTLLRRKSELGRYFIFTTAGALIGAVISRLF